MQNMYYKVIKESFACIRNYSTNKVSFTEPRRRLVLSTNVIYMMETQYFVFKLSNYVEVLSVFVCGCGVAARMELYYN
jgi:hypothetical protein